MNVIVNNNVINIDKSHIVVFFALVDQYILAKNKDYKTKNKRRVTFVGLNDITTTLKTYIETYYAELKQDANVAAIITHLKSSADFQDLKISLGISKSPSQVDNTALHELTKTIIDGLEEINTGLKGIIDSSTPTTPTSPRAVTALTKGGGIQLSHIQLRTALTMYVAFLFLALSLAITQPLIDKYTFGQDKWGLLFVCIYSGLLSVLFGLTRHIGACVSLIMVCGACMALLYALG